MSNIGKGVLGLISGCVMVLGVPMIALAAMTGFDTYLPAYQMDTEVSMVKKADTYSVWTITLDEIGDTEITNTICAWTESDGTGANYSNQYQQIAVGSHILPYDKRVPSVGDNVVLNLDNPVSTAMTVRVKGSWSPY